MITTKTSADELKLFLNCNTLGITLYRRREMDYRIDKVFVCAFKIHNLYVIMPIDMLKSEIKNKKKTRPNNLLIIRYVFKYFFLNCIVWM